jgi:hypothetical protein
MAAAIKLFEVETGVQLSITIKQAKALSALLFRVGGSPKDSARGSLNEISVALEGVGYYGDYGTEVSNSIYFKSDVL